MILEFGPGLCRLQGKNEAQIRPGPKQECLVRATRTGLPNITSQSSAKVREFPKRTVKRSALAQLSAKPTNEEKSIGLGLTIVKHIIDAHGGKGDDLGYSSVTTVPMGDKPDLAATNAACKKRHQFAPQQKTDADFNNPSPGLVAGC